MKKVFLIILVTIAAFAIFLAVLLFALSRIPSTIVFQSYPDRQCIIVEIVNDMNELEKISCAKFEQTEDYNEGNYATQWGGRPFD